MKATNFYQLVFGVVLIFASVWLVATAQDFSSPNFTVSNPVTLPGGYASSENFGLTSVLSQIVVGSSTATSFKNFAGFLYFPFASSPSISVSPGDAQVLVSWTVTETALGWTVGGYRLGKSGTAGGPYTFTSAGNLLSTMVTGLTNGTPYYFVVQATDSGGNVIATSTEVSATPVAPVTPPILPPGGGGGGGGGGGNQVITGVQLSGRAFPLSRVTVLKDGQIVTTAIAGPDAQFSVQLSNLTPGNYVFSVYGEDDKGTRSTLFTFPSQISSGVLTTIGGIFIAPTIYVDKSVVKKGDTISIFGKSVPEGKVSISVNSNQEYFDQVNTDKTGAYFYQFDTSLLELGQHHAKSKALVANMVSAYGQSVGFTVGDTSLPKTPGPLKGDLNRDGRVNLVDFSIAAYWFKRPLPAGSPGKIADLNADGKVDLVDLSIIAYYWTG